MIVVQKTSKYCDFYHISTSVNDKYNENTLLNNLELLKKFILYYRPQVHKIIETAQKYPTFIPSEKNNILLLADKYHKQVKKNHDDFYFENGIKYNNNHISKREIECLQWLSMGKTSKETGIILNISQRTVEKHLDAIKYKLGCYKNTFLIKKAMEICLI